jgi:ribosome-binding protein aMBF1 (putative translation factor)
MEPMARKRTKLPDSDMQAHLKRIMASGADERSRKEDEEKREKEKADLQEFLRRKKEMEALRRRPEEPDSPPVEAESLESATTPNLSDQGDWGAIIRDRIKAKGWSGLALGNASGLNSSIILRFMAGERDIRLETAQKLCAALGLALVPFRE